MMMLSGSSRLSFTLTPKKDRPEICPNASKVYFHNLEALIELVLEKNKEQNSIVHENKMQALN